MTEFSHSSPDEPQTSKTSAIHNVFIGKDGLRAGWSLLIAIVLFAMFFSGLNALIHKTHLVPPHALESSPTPIPVLITEGAAFLVTLIVTWIMSKIECRPMSVYGLGGRRKLSHFLGGAVWGVLFLSLLVLVLVKTGLLVIDGRLLFGADVFRYALAWIPAFLAIAFFEEYFFRGYLQYTLTRGLAGIYRRIFKNKDSNGLGFWTAAILVSFGFGFVHGSNPGESPVGLLCAGLASLVFCLSLWRTGSLWWAIGLHTAWDWSQSFLYGVGDSGAFFSFRLLATHPVGKPILSGGATGPEGSILILPMLFLLVLVIIFTLPRDSSKYRKNLPAEHRQAIEI
ncbi:MAG TPA: CPBP family intramembrane glutamic endopeptidase [Edaphobacter sp.]